MLLKENKTKSSTEKQITAIIVHEAKRTATSTRNKAVIDLGPKEACTGLTFVCLSRAKTCRPDRRAHEYNSALMYLVLRYVYVGTYVPGLVYTAPQQRTDGQFFFPACSN